jgi:hypothetical protein
MGGLEISGLAHLSSDVAAFAAEALQHKGQPSRWMAALKEPAQNTIQMREIKKWARA